ncbi:MAG TPA: sigma-70 family RNA polymerase sigma factor [Actinomycetota bacterium]|nr:sigma-70 family RNA polymerase sigma factor [Actinomycetota bacterium]
MVRDEGRRVLATLVRTVGDVGLAEDAVQDAAERALQVWPRDGVPDSPRAWLTVTARRRAIDILRHERGRGAREAAAMELRDPAGDVPPPDSVVRDDLLRLVFTCCHPTLSLEAQVALALRTLCGLSTAEVARALLVPEPTMVKRLTRAKQKIRQAAIPYRIPPDHELPDRLAGVAATVYLLFNEGYSATGDDDPLRVDLIDEAVRLGRLLAGLLPDEPSVLGLLAVMLLTDARRPTRLDGDGGLVLLADQDRRRWRHELIREGVVLVGQGLRRSPDRPDPYVVQAAIAACHVLAPGYAATDWAAIVSWYDVLLTVHDTPVTRLNRAVAIGERDGPAAGLAEVERVDSLAAYPLWHAARAELLHRLGRTGPAAAAYQSALALGPNRAQRRHLEGRLAEAAQAEVNLEICDRVDNA